MTSASLFWVKPHCGKLCNITPGAQPGVSAKAPCNFIRCAQIYSLGSFSMSFCCSPHPPGKDLARKEAHAHGGFLADCNMLWSHCLSLLKRGTQVVSFLPSQPSVTRDGG